jgi:hemoglobin
MSDKQVPTLYEWVGGKELIGQLFATFYDRVRVDPVLAPVFAQMPSHHSQTVAHFVSEVLGGPALYSGDAAHSHSTMVAKHLGKHLTEQQRKRWVTLLIETADDLKVRDDPEFRSALAGYLEWGSRIAVLNSNTTENPIDEKAPMPRWGWGEVKGPYIP